MRKLLFIAAVSIPAVLQAQNTLTSDLVEGGKALVELIKVIKMPRIITTAEPVPVANYTDSCGIKKLADISFKNKTNATVQVLLFLRIENTYSLKPLSLTLAALSQESLYALKTGIYKYKVETGLEDDESITLNEGELKLEPCDKLIREIKERL